MAEFATQSLLQTDTMTVRTVCCRGSCRGRGAEECTDATHLVFPYRGLYLRHVGRDQAVADANHVLFFNRGQGYQLRLRLARALDLLAHYDDLSALAHDLGFSSHSHFTAAFRDTYGRSPSAFKQATRS